VEEKYGVVASNRVVGDKCLFQEHGLILSVEVVGIELMKEEQVFYTISAGSAHCFFANGILVHDENVALLDLLGTGMHFVDLVSEPALAPALRHTLERPAREPRGVLAEQHPLGFNNEPFHFVA